MWGTMHSDWGTTCEMKKLSKHESIVAAVIVAVLLMAGALSAYLLRTFNFSEKDKFKKIRPGSSLEEVKRTLGDPTRMKLSGGVALIYDRLYPYGYYIIHFRKYGNIEEKRAVRMVFVSGSGEGGHGEYFDISGSSFPQ